MSKFIDLSHHLEMGMPVYPGMAAPKFYTTLTHAEAESRGTYAPGTTFQIAAYELAGNTGTYIDSPFHRHPHMADLSGLALDTIADVPGIVVLEPEEGAIGIEKLGVLDLKGKAVLLHTGWAKHWGGDYFRSGPYLPAETCHFLVKAGVKLVGIDCANIDNMKDTSRPAHTILLAAGIPIVEHLTGLENLPETGFRFFAVPPAIVGGTSFAVRAFAVVD